MIVYHVSEAGQPEVHDTSTGEWFFEPEENHGDVYSNGYPSREAARTEADKHEMELQWEEETRIQQEKEDGRYDALVSALILAVTAPTQEKSDECVKMAETLAAGLTSTQVASARAEAEAALEE